jgi:Glycosyltransferase 61
MRAFYLLCPSGIRVVSVPKGQHIMAGSCVAISPPGHIPFEPRLIKGGGDSHGSFSSSAIKPMVSKIKARVQGNVGYGARIYVRRNSGLRNLVNSSQIEDLLVQHGFVIIEPERMSFDEQVMAFSGADVVFGATGAAMANILFCRPEAEVCIFISKHPETPYYYWQQLARSVSLRIKYLLGDMVASGRHGVHSDFWVPLQDVLAALKKTGIA